MKEKYADIIVDVSHEKLDHTFQYEIPEALQGHLSNGMRVTIPFGRGNKETYGYVVRLSNQTTYDATKIKQIIEISPTAVTIESKLIALAAWMKDTYGSTMIKALKTVMPVKKQVKKRGSQEPQENQGKPSEALTKAQETVLQAIEAEWQGLSRPSLIHGVTGSGKTHIYIKLIEKMLVKGQQSIVLIPEIALTYQTVNRFYEIFGDKVAVIHSRMSQGARFEAFEQARSGKIQIMIGPRTALFTSFPNLGLIIIDEEQEGTYKNEGMPRFHAREVAIARGEIEGAKVVLASATPSLESYYRCQNGEYALFTLDERFGVGELPTVAVVDLREELKNGNSGVLSNRLACAMEHALNHKEQIMLFLNRRGYAGFVSCRSCGHVVKCPHCDVALSLHNNGKMACHYCGYEIKEVTKCSECGSSYISSFKAGTQQIEAIVKKRFPQAKVLRMDMDTTSGKDGHAKILAAFEKHKADILIGTQMIVKGHDFKKVSLVGVLAADLSLYADDYACAERTFQLLVQAVGRAGRANDKGEAIIQTYNPEHYCIEAAKTQDYQAFYEEEIGYRELLGYPPASHMLAIMASGEDEATLSLAMEYIKKYILTISKAKQLSAIGPANASVAKINDRYRKVLYLKNESPKELVKIRDEVERYIEINSGFDEIYIQFDLN